MSFEDKGFSNIDREALDRVEHPTVQRSVIEAGVNNLIEKPELELSEAETSQSIAMVGGMIPDSAAMLVKALLQKNQTSLDNSVVTIANSNSTSVETAKNLVAVEAMHKSNVETRSALKPNDIEDESQGVIVLPYTIDIHIAESEPIYIACDTIGKPLNSMRDKLKPGGKCVVIGKNIKWLDIAEGLGLKIIEQEEITVSDGQASMVILEKIDPIITEEIRQIIKAFDTKIKNVLTALMGQVFFAGMLGDKREHAFQRIKDIKERFTKKRDVMQAALDELQTLKTHSDPRVQDLATTMEHFALSKKETEFSNIHMILDVLNTIEEKVEAVLGSDRKVNLDQETKLLADFIPNMASMNSGARGMYDAYRTLTIETERDGQ